MDRNRNHPINPCPQECDYSKEGVCYWVHEDGDKEASHRWFGPNYSPNPKEKVLCRCCGATLSIADYRDALIKEKTFARAFTTDTWRPFNRKLHLLAFLKEGDPNAS